MNEFNTLARKLTTSDKIQEFVNKLTYNQDGRLSPLNVIHKKRGDCIEAATLACAILLAQKKTAFLIDLRAVRDDDHILCVFLTNGHFGAIAQSKFLGLRYRPPAFSTVRELVMSYIPHYFNYFGEYSLREYSEPFLLHTRKDDWFGDDTVMCAIEKEINEIAHFPIYSRKAQLARVSPEQFWADVRIIPKGQKIGKVFTQHLKK